jgi:polar amino acid transport system substrate-binding protein
LNFVAALDDPPFSFLDEASKLRGFSVFLARAICEELDYSNSCVISGRLSRSLSDETATNLENIVISSAGAAMMSREKFKFSRPFLRIPGRFVSRRRPLAGIDFSKGLPGTKVGTVANSAEERMLRSYFPAAAITGFADKSLLWSELATGKIDLAFANGLQIASWLLSEDSKECCQFTGGPYYSVHFLGEGVRFAIPAADGFLVPQIDAALMSLQQKGKIQELFLRFFPVNFYVAADGQSDPQAID